MYCFHSRTMYSDRDGTATKQSQFTYDTHMRFLRLASGVLSSIGFAAVIIGEKYSAAPSQWWSIDYIWRCNWHDSASLLWVGVTGGAADQVTFGLRRSLTIALFIAHSLCS